MTRLLVTLLLTLLGQSVEEVTYYHNDTLPFGWICPGLMRLGTRLFPSDRAKKPSASATWSGRCAKHDYLGLDRELAVEDGELLTVLCAGAYGATMSANDNTRPRAPEVMVDADRDHLVRGRETIEDRMRDQQVGPE